MTGADAARWTPGRAGESMIDYLNGDELRPGASAERLAQLEQELGVQLPDDDRGFLGLSDGCNGDVGARGYAQLWSADELISANKGYEVTSLVPDLVLIGSNGGPTAYGIGAGSPSCRSRSGRCSARRSGYWAARSRRSLPRWPRAKAGDAGQPSRPLTFSTSRCGCLSS